jgi:acyl-CoA synthetase (AMP-forming)/AMP-acid ligase II
MATPAPDPLSVYAQAQPDKAAVIDGDDVISFAALNAEVNRLGNGLLSLGLRGGERAVWCGPNSRQVLTFIHAARKTGMVAVPLAYRFTAEEMQYVIDNSDATLVVVDAEQASLIASIRDRLPKVKEVIVYGGAAFDGAAFPGARTWDDVVARGDESEPVAVDPSFGATMIYTSGTTGKPKGALRTRTDAALVLSLITELRMKLGEEVHITTGPLYHSGPNAFAVLTHTLGGTIVVLRKFDPTRWIELVKEHRVTSTFTAPTQLKRIVSLPADVLAGADLTSMHTLIANAAPVPYALKQEVVEKLGDGFLFEVYGSTELGVDTVLPPEDQLRKPGSCGKPYGGIELKVVDVDGNPCPPNQPGELFIRTTLAMDGYHRTAETLHEIEAGDEPAGSGGQGWKSVGDVARIDDEGYVYICDRKKDMIISGGMNIYPAEVESVLHAYPDVMDVAVFGVPDEEWGEKVHAVVQPRAGRTIDLAHIEAYANENLAGYKRPRSWEFRDELPRTESGKLLKRVLREEHWSGRESKV